MADDSARFTVWARVAWAAIDMARRGGLPIEPLFVGMPFDADSVRKAGKIDWSDYCVITERIEELAGGPEACAELLASSYHQSYPELTGLLITPRVIFSVVLELCAMLAFSALALDIVDLEPNLIRHTMTIRPGARGSLAFVRGSAVANAQLTRHLGLPPCKIESLDYGPRHLDMVLRLPEAPPIVDRLKRASRAIFRNSVSILLGYTAGAPVTVNYDVVPPSEPRTRVTTARQAWKLSPRQTEVLAEVARGHANKEIASILDCTEATVEAHVTQLLHRAGVSSRAQLIARFWSGL